jgi:hypothetical protein
VFGNKAPSRGGSGKARNEKLVSIDRLEGGFLHRANGDTAGLGGVQVWEGTDKGPEIMGEARRVPGGLSVVILTAIDGGGERL